MREAAAKLLKSGERFQGTRDQLPPYAMSMVMADRDLSRAITVYRDLEDQRQNIAASESIIRELKGVLENAEGIGGFDQIRYDLQLDRSLGVQRHYELAQLEADVLAQTLSGDAKRQAESVGAGVEEFKNPSLQAIAEAESVSQATSRVRRSISSLHRVAP